MLELKTTREVAEELGVLDWEIEAAIRRRELPRPPVVGRTRLWSITHVAALRDALSRRARTGPERRGAGA